LQSVKKLTLAVLLKIKQLSQMKTISQILHLVFLSVVFTGIISAQSSGFLKISVNQTASVYLDNKNLGDVEPGEERILEVKPGIHQLKVIRDGYKTHVEEITISAPNEILEKKITLLRPDNFEVDKDVSGSRVGVEYGELTIITKVSGGLVAAKVYVDDKYADNAPAKITRLFVGRHTIRVEYNSMVKTRVVDVRKDKNDIIEIEFMTYSEVRFISPQSGIRGTIDLSREIEVPSVYNISQGEHGLSFSKPGLMASSREFYFDGEHSYRVEVDLRNTYPVVTPEDIGRVNKTLYTSSDFERPTNYRPQSGGRPWNDWKLAGGFVALVGIGIGTAFLSDNPYVYWGAGIGAACLTYSIIPPTRKDRDNYNYNRERVPEILREKNAPVREYNQQTQRLIEEKQKKDYQEAAINITQE
jgi:hypothetical protein